MPACTECLFFLFHLYDVMVVCEVQQSSPVLSVRRQRLFIYYIEYIFCLFNQHKTMRQEKHMSSSPPVCSWRQKAQDDKSYNSDDMACNTAIRRVRHMSYRDACATCHTCLPRSFRYAISLRLAALLPVSARQPKPELYIYTQYMPRAGGSSAHDENGYAALCRYAAMPHDVMVVYLPRTYELRRDRCRVCRFIVLFLLV